MNSKRTFEQDYKNLKRLETPDLWSRIEKNLNEHPDRNLELHHNLIQPDLEIRTSDDSKNRQNRPSPASRQTDWHLLSARAVSGLAAAAAAVILFVVLAPWQNHDLPIHSGGMAETAAEAPDIWAGENTTRETEGIRPSADGALTMSPPPVNYDSPEESTTAGKAQIPPSSSTDALFYSQLTPTPLAPLTVPDCAQTVPEDAVYFSEDILGDTELLCQGTVTASRLETDETGSAVTVSYDIALDQVYYSQDYLMTASVTVTAPIIEAVSDSEAESHVLYQLLTGATYLLPLKKDEQECWQLLCASAPQVQLTTDGAYLFHSGYTTLADSRAQVVIGNQEGANDYYYDKMLLREDDDFLTDFIALTRR